MPDRSRLAVLVSGSGTNLQALLDAIDADPDFGGQVVVVGSDRPGAGGLDRARAAGIPAVVEAVGDHPDRGAWERALVAGLQQHRPDAVVLAGFMRILTGVFLGQWPGHVVNTHPSILPAFRGAHAVREALDWGVKLTGCTVHLVDEQVDHGPVVAQEAVAVRQDDDEHSLHARIKAVEHRLLPASVKLLCQGRLHLDGRRVFVAPATPTTSSPATDRPPGATMSDVTPIRRALVSVYDKTGLEDLAHGLARHGIAIVSTGSTAARIRAAGVQVTEVADLTGFPECLDGRVKTLHPRIHAGLLADRSKPDHRRQLEELRVEPIDLVVGNLYPFHDAVSSGAGDDEVVEMIDIGGPTMVRAAAKNFAHVGVVVEPADYGWLVGQLDARGGLSGDDRRRLAATAFDHVAAYDAAIANWFNRGEAFPGHVHVSLERRGEPLRYGENPHQAAAAYVDALDPDHGLGSARQLHGKAMSYNNFVDTDAALGMVADFTDPCVAIIKHTNPAGLAVADGIEDAYVKALAGDPVSAFGGIVAANRSVDTATARRIAEVFTEVVIAPGYDDDALGVLTGKANLRILQVDRVGPAAAVRTLRSIDGMMLVQDGDVGAEPFDHWAVVSQAQPDEAVLAELRFAWMAAKHVKSNAIVLTKDHAVVGVGAGQMSRVDSVRIAVDKSDGRHHGAVLASDAFFPFRDGPDAAVAAGITAIVQPGGSKRDAEVIEAADEAGIVMVTTGRRHFRH